jgi:hypothetical protein
VCGTKLRFSYGAGRWCPLVFVFNILANSWKGRAKTLAISHWPYHKRDLRELLECKLLAMVVVGADNIIAWIWSCYLTKSNASIGIYSLNIPSQDY